MKKIHRHIFGWFFIVLGILGLFLPVLQGILFLIIGAMILAPEIPFFDKLLHRLRMKYPGLYTKATNITKNIRNFFYGREKT